MEADFQDPKAASRISEFSEGFFAGIVFRPHVDFTAGSREVDTFRFYAMEVGRSPRDRTYHGCGRESYVAVSPQDVVPVGQAPSTVTLSATEVVRYGSSDSIERSPFAAARLLRYRPADTLGPGELLMKAGLVPRGRMV